jgi:hypothetical protein
LAQTPLVFREFISNYSISTPRSPPTASRSTSHALSRTGRMQALGRRRRADWNHIVAEVENHIAWLQLDRAQRVKDVYPNLVRTMRIPDEMIPHSLTTFTGPSSERPLRRCRESRPESHLTGPQLMQSPV